MHEINIMKLNKKNKNILYESMHCDLGRFLRHISETSTFNNTTRSDMLLIKDVLVSVTSDVINVGFA